MLTLHQPIKTRKLQLQINIFLLRLLLLFRAVIGSYTSCDLVCGCNRTKFDMAEAHNDEFSSENDSLCDVDEIEGDGYVYEPLAEVEERLAALVVEVAPNRVGNGDR